MLKPTLQLRLGQQLTMTPQLQQAIRLLQLPIMDLHAHLREALEQNVMLDADEPSIETGGEQEAETPDSGAAETDVAQVEVETSWEDTQLTAAAESGWTSNEPRESREFADRSGGTLAEHLLWQLQLESPGPREYLIGEAKPLAFSSSKNSLLERNN